jgi:EAL domain-containing protein (putative c-di-GMP-specific phosphodiesterase class I)
MIQTAFAKLQLFENKNHPIRFIFDFNIKQFEMPNFIDKIIKIIQLFSSDKQQIIMRMVDQDEIELSIDLTTKAIQALNEASIPIAIGLLIFGNLTHHKVNRDEMHLTYLCLDEKLIKEINEREESVEMLKKIIQLANTMKMEILVKDVNTLQQKQILDALGCKLMQGDVFE